MKRYVLPIVTGIILGFMLFWKLNLGLTRYFDADEFAYLHWAHNVFTGRLPYRDFLLYVPPGFLWVLSPLFLFFQGTAILTAGRVFAWVVYVGICVALGVILVELRGNRGSRGIGRIRENLWLLFLPGVVLSFLPLPADKFLEIRPDNLAMLMALIGLIGEIRAIREKKKNWFFWAGVLYGVSLLILPKTLPQVAVAVLVGRSWPLVAGIGLPLILFALWALPLGDMVWYSLTKLPFEVNRLGELYPMGRDLFFYPNEIYYGAKGWSTGLLANHAVWLVGLFVGIHWLLSREFLIAGSMFAYILAFMYGYELRHAQYLIPIAVFVALFTADGIRKIGVIGPATAKLCGVKALGVIGPVTASLYGVKVLGGLVLLWGMLQVFVAVNQPKMAWTNEQDYLRLERVLATVPKDATVFDLVGATIFYNDPYYVSAVPFDQWQRYLSRPLPTLLLPKGTYIYRDKLGRMDRVVPYDPKVYHYLQ